MVSYSSVDFLPICDLLFNFISVASYFCDIAFHIIVAYTFYRDGGLNYWFLVIVCATIVSLFACQTLSMKWYIEDEEQEDRSNAAKTFVYCIHLFQCGVLWRYSKLLFLPMGSSIPLVKREMRNLCILRMIHGFCQGLPLLFVQGFLMANKASEMNKHMDQVHTVSVALSFFGICWSLASFNKNVRSKDIDKLVLTWIGVIFQLLWRLGTVSSRVLALVVYASAWPDWIILVLALHWLCMFLWFLVQHQDSEVLGKNRWARLLWSFILSYVHNIAYINIEKNKDTRLKIAVYYAVTFVENILLVSLWTTSKNPKLDFTPEQRRDVVMIVVLAFVVGLFFMLLYYRLFHTSKISSAFQRSSDPTENGSSGTNGQNRNGKSQNISEKVDMTEYSNNQAVFNCVLNPAMRKKKKIPSVPPPPPDGSSSTTSAVSGHDAGAISGSGHVTTRGIKASTPFWKEPLPLLSNTISNTTETDSIRQKLQTKRDNQQKQLQLIENEIRAGNIKRPPVPPQLHAMPLPPVGRLPHGVVPRPIGGHGQHVHRDPGVHPYLNIHDPLNDSSGDQGDVDSGDEGFPHYNQIYRRRESKHAQQSRYETPL